MSLPAFRIVNPGLGASVQDKGRRGWRRFGVPRSGVLDAHAAEAANLLLNNPANAPVVEFLWGGAEIEVLSDIWLAVTGAGLKGAEMWRTHYATVGETLRFSAGQAGVWSYLGVEGGVSAPMILGSVSSYPRGGIGAALKRGDVLFRCQRVGSHFPEHVVGRFLSSSAIPDYSTPPAVRVWPAPQWQHFEPAVRQAFFAQNWEVSSQSDRVGYRLLGSPLRVPSIEMISEPVRVGSVQVPPNGLPIITMPDGPTVGGYLKLGLVDEADLRWVAQTRPGGKLRFRLVEQEQGTAWT